MSASLQVLIVEHDPNDIELVVHALRRGGYDPTYRCVDNAQALTNALEAQPWDVILCDYALPGFSGPEALHITRSTHGLDVPFIVVSGAVGEEAAIELMRTGAQDFVLKNNLSRLVMAIRRELRVADTLHEKRKIEGRLDFERELLRQLMDSMPDTIAFKDTQRRYTHINPALCRLMNLNKEDILGRTADAIGAPAVARTDEEIVLATGCPLIDRIEKRTTADGEDQWFSATRAPLRDKDGMIVGLAVIARDITDRIQAENEHHAVAQRLHKVLELAGDAIVAVDENQRITVFNVAAEAMFGYKLDEVLEQSFDMLRPSGVAAVHRKHLSDFERAPQMSREMSSRQPVFGRRKNGDEFPAEASISKFLDNGKTHFIAVVRNITDRLKIGEQLVQAQKMEAVGQLTGGIAHDFNNLLMVIIGNLDLLNDMMSSNPAARELVEDSLTAALSGAALSKGLLAFGRRQVLNPEQVDINPLVADQVQLLRRTLGEGIVVEMMAAKDACQTIADPTQLRCALTNLAINARDAMPNGGTLTVRTYIAVLGEDDVRGHEGLQPGQFSVMEVSDTGAGIPSQKLEKIFEPFFTTKEVGKGAGLGLSMVYGFAKQTHGKISVSSEVGRGTTFSLYLPYAEASAAADRVPATSAALATAHETILVVDDNVTVRKAVIAQLRSLGYSTLEAGTASEALDIIAKNEPFDLLFTDIVMPGGMSGIELARTAREQKGDLKLLLTSGFPDLKKHHETDSFMSNSILSKPYRRDQLQQALRAVIDNG